MPRTRKPADPPTIPDRIRALPTYVLAGAVHERGKCVAALVDGPAAVDPWHPTTDTGHAPKAGAYARRARLACAGCPVIVECLEWALRRESAPGAGPPHGVYGGLAPAERRRLLGVRDGGSDGSCCGGGPVALMPV